MISALTINRNTGNGKHADVLDVCEALGNADLGSATNALVVLARQSPLFHDTLERIRSSDSNVPRKDADCATESRKQLPATSG